MVVVESAVVVSIRFVTLCVYVGNVLRAIGVAVVIVLWYFVVKRSTWNICSVLGGFESLLCVHNIRIIL